MPAGLKARNNLAYDNAIRKSMSAGADVNLHDENVLTYKGVLYFIDTVFYLK